MDHLARDFDAIRERLIALIQSTFPEWTDFEVASFGTILLEMFAFVGDVLGFYLDSHARESRLSTATQRRSVIALARMLGYRLHGARAATAELAFALDEPAGADIVIPRGTAIRTPEVTEGVRFQLLADVVLPAGAVGGVGIAEHSEEHSVLVDTRGARDCEVPLDRAPYLDGSARVTTPQGVFTEVESFLDSKANDLHFAAAVDTRDRATLRFGAAPPSGPLRVVYRTGGGSTGNVEAGRLRVLDAGLRDATGRAVRVRVSNPKRASGGVERQTIASAKLLAPEALRATTRTVCREDFEIHAREVPGVARALMLTSNEDVGVAENTGVLFIVAAGGGPSTPALRNAVLRQVTEVYPCTLTFDVRVQDAAYRGVAVRARMAVTDRAAAGRVRAALQEFFRVSLPDGTPNPRVDFGFGASGELAWSDVFNVIRDTPGVRKVTDLALNGARGDLRLRREEFPVLAEVRLEDEGGLPL